MGKRGLLIILIALLLAFQQGEASAVDVSIDTQFPTFILEDHINLTGTSTNTTGTIIESVEVSVDGGPWQTTSGDPYDWYLNVSLHDGDYDIEVRATDSTGASALKRVPVKVDLYPPTGDILIEDGRYAHNSTAIKIDVAANDTHGPIEMQMSRTPDFSQSTWWPHYPCRTYGLIDEPEGNVTIYLRLRDAAGRISETYNDTIVIDTTPPEGTLLINEGAKYTNGTTVTLRWNATDITGVVAMMVSNDPDFEGAIWEDPMNAFSGIIGEADGVHTVYLKIQDFVGWETVLVDDIILDRTPPSATLIIDHDASFTTSRDVTLNITLYDENPLSYKLTNQDEPWPNSWRTTGSPVDIPWPLVWGPDGDRMVRMLVMDAAGNEVLRTDNIVLDTTLPEGTLLLNGGAAFTNQQAANVTLIASDVTSGVDKMRISESDDFTSSSWRTFEVGFIWPMPAGDGTKTLFVQVRDVAGLVSTFDASIILDTSPPSGIIWIRNVGDYAVESNVIINMEMDDDLGLDMMMVSQDQTFPNAEWLHYSSRHPWDLGTEEGEVTVYVRVRDLAGNTFTTSVSTILDLTSPQGSVLIEAGAEHTLSRENRFTWSASDANGIFTYRYHINEVDRTEPWTFVEGLTTIGGTDEVFTHDIDTNEPVQIRLILEVVDVSGRMTYTDDTIWYVPARPEGRVIVADGSGWTNSTSIDVKAEWTGGLEATHYRASLAFDGLDVADWVPIDQTLELFPTEPGGHFMVHCELLGRFNITSDRISQAILQDILPPVIDIVSPAMDSTEDGMAKLSVSVSDDLDPDPAVEYRLNGGELMPYSVEQRLDLKEGDNLIEVRAEDAAGNVGNAEWTIRYDKGLSVGGASWLILLVIVVVVAIVVLWYWRNRTGGQGQ